jgi:aromatic ring-opening dioxygenase catalytic subunit (LigB family)
MRWTATRRHDFGGFSRALYDLRYPAPGSPAFAAHVAERLRAGGFECNIDRQRGLDHGAWVPLLWMYIGSGSFTHDLSEFHCHNPNIPAPDLGQQFCRLVPCGADLEPNKRPDIRSRTTKLIILRAFYID